MRVWHILFLAALALAGSAPAGAALISFTVTDPNQSGSVGDSLTYEGTVTDDGLTGDLYVNGYWVDSADPALAAATSFLFPIELWPLGAGDSFTGDLFTADLSLLTPGTYSGTFWLRGGPTNADMNDLASASFSVTVLDAGGGGNTPEPATLALLGAGLAIAGARRRRRRARYRWRTPAPCVAAK